MRLRWTQRARADLRAIGQFIARDNPRAARAWVTRLQDRARRAAGAPRSGRVVAEVGDEDIREVLLGAYRIVYRVRPRVIEILTVFEGHRLLRPQDLGD